MWGSVPCPPHAKPIGCKWIYSAQLKPDGSLDRHKVCLVALGNGQEYGVDYDKSSVPVAEMTAIRILLALAASQS